MIVQGLDSPRNYKMPKIFLEGMYMGLIVILVSNVPSYLRW